VSGSNKHPGSAGSALASESSTASTGSKAKRFALSSINVVLAFLILAAGVAVIKNRADARQPTHSETRVTVPSTTIERSNSYQIERQFVGLIEASQTTDLAFETGGTVQELLVQEGDTVRKGDALAILEQSSLKAQRDQLLASHQASALAVERADLALQRELDLSNKGYGSAEALDNARLSTKDASAALVRVEAQIREINVRLVKSVLKSPFDAVIGERLVDTGSVVANGQPVLRIYDESKLTARVGIPTDLQHVWNSGDTVRLVVDGREYIGRYAGNRPDVAAGTRVIETRFELQNDGGDLPAVGQLVQMYWEETEYISGYWVPVIALSEGKRGLWSVLRLDVEENTDDGDRQNELATVVREHVEVIHTDGDRAYIEASMSDSVQIADGGSDRVVPCLLYTSDAADELLRLGCGGRGARSHLINNNL